MNLAGVTQLLVKWSAIVVTVCPLKDVNIDNLHGFDSWDGSAKTGNMANC